MYEMNTRNLKLYLLVSSVIFLLTHGLPLLYIFDTQDQEREIILNKGDNFIIVTKNNNNNKNYYSVNATVIKHSIMYDINTQYFTSNVILEYNNNIDNHYYCKINIDILEKKTNNFIYGYISKYYSLM